MNTETSAQQAYQDAVLTERRRIQSIVECPEARSRPAKARELALDDQCMSLEQAKQELARRPAETGGAELDAGAIYRRRNQRHTDD